MSKEHREGGDGPRPADGTQGYDALGNAHLHGQIPADAPQAHDPAAEPTPRNLDHALDTIDRLRAEIAEKASEIEQGKDRLLRERADLENFKRRMQRDKSEALRYASEHLLRDLLPVIDNLERAIDAAAKGAEGESPEQAARVDNLVTGVTMVLHQFAETLGRFGVTRVAAAGQHFDPAHHEAVAHVDTEQHPAGAVVDEHAPGYRLHERLLRPAQVTVAKPKG
ncbi:MAG: nucleotide exchange factor GrpE [Deltaproteobacteria bacterium]|nr:nucleotide exchange factor GrpE [Deltaproteobacteria bacterium]